ncbi:MAG: hypothetical protein HC892_07090 [Saprospiraceae bacterium]|nr:hypothetical protein [Saprospiraceae bacterium]
MKNNSRIEARIKHAIVGEFRIADRYLSSETNFKEDLGFDDYDMLFLSLALEDEFELLFTEQLEFEEMRDLVKLVSDQLKTDTYIN